MDLYAFAIYAASLTLLVGVLGIITYSVLRGFRGRNMMLAITAMIFGAGLLLRLPVQESTLPFLERLALAAVDALRYFTMDVPFVPGAQLGNALLTSWYRQLDVILNFSAPMCTTIILLSVLQMLGWVRFRLFIWRPVYCFSELNERSFALARSIMQDWASRKGDFFKPVLVFFKTETHDDSVELQYRAEAQQLGAAFYREPIHAVRLPDPWYRRVKVFLIDRDEDSNMGTATRMKDWICPMRKRGIFGRYTDSDLLVFSTKESAEVVFDKLLEEMERRRTELYGHEKTKKKDKDNEKENVEDARIDLHLVNETRLIAQKLLWEHPLYEALEGSADGEISVLIVGGGRLGMEILRTALVCGVMNNFTLRVTVVDAKGDEIKKQFDHTYGQLPESIQDKVQFKKADVKSTEFDEILEEQTRKPDYILVATGDDEQNVTTAQFIQRYYARREILKEDQKYLTSVRPVHVAIRDQGRYEALEVLRSDGLDLFGCHADIFCRKMLLDRPLDRAAMMFHSAYKEKTVELKLMLPQHYSRFHWFLYRVLNHWDQEVRNAKHKYYTQTAVDLHSNQMVVLHSIYKFRDLLSGSEDKEQLARYQALLKAMPEKEEAAEAAFSILVRAMHQKWKSLYEMEHRRWEVFQTLDGWQPFPMDRLEAYGKKQKELNDVYWDEEKKAVIIPEEERLTGLNKHKHMTARLHGCLISSDRLEKLAESVNLWFSTKAKPGNAEFVEYDKMMCITSLFAWLELVASGPGVEQLREAVRGCLDPVLKKEKKAGAERILGVLKDRFARDTKA